MDFSKEFNEIMGNTALIALATTEKDNPNVRIINFCFDSKNADVIYVPTFKQSPKTDEFSKNNKVAFMTIPGQTKECVRVKKATIQKSGLNINDIKDGLVKNSPEYAFLIENSGAGMEVYEIRFKEAIVSLGHGKSGIINF